MDDLTAVQRKGLLYINEHVATSGRAPTLRELCGFMGYSAIGSAQDLVAALRRKGYLEKNERQLARALAVTAKTRSEVNEDFSQWDNHSVLVPCLGAVPAGHPREAIEDSIGTLSVAKTLLPKKSLHSEKLYALRASGASMIGAGIFDGDWLVVRFQEDADAGQIVVARIGEEATVKRLMHDPDAGWYLKAENPVFTDTFARDRNFLISGVVVALQRSLA